MIYIVLLNYNYFIPTKRKRVYPTATWSIIKLLILKGTKKMSKKINHLVVDTTAFMKAANLQDLADNVYTIQEVIDEITNDRQRRKLVVLPYELKVKDVFTDSIKFITEFSKKTGDYTSLSATDIKVMALAYQLEKDIIGIDHLKTTPTIQKFVKVTGIGNFKLHPDSDKDQVKDEDIENIHATKSDNAVADLKDSENDTHKDPSTNVKGDHKPITLETTNQNIDVNRVELDTLNGKDNEEGKATEEISEQIKNITLSDEILDNVMVRVSDEENSESEETSDSDEGEWITPSNLATKKKEMDVGELEDRTVEVACITSDFAMQNVLKQIGLNVTAIDGRVIKQLRTFIFRCTTCFKTTSVMTKLFCPKCGHATLRKVGVSIDDEGNQHIHINGRKPLTARGKRFSLPTPRGGQHFQYPILTEDQPIHKRFATKLARNKTNALDPDYTAGFSPFVMKDVNSKSAILGVRADKQDIKYWMKHYSKGKKK